MTINWCVEFRKLSSEMLLEIIDLFSAEIDERQIVRRQEKSDGTVTAID